MDLLELQQRANVLVDKVNEYEESLIGLELDENQVINEHKYVDIFCLRPVLKLLFGKDVSEKLSRTTVNDIDFNLISSNAPANNTTISFFENTYSTVEHPFVQNIDMWNNYNMTQLDIQQLKQMTREEAIEKGIGLSYSSNIKDALVTESQVANLFNWNTTSDVLTKNNTYTFNRQVPGLVLYYLGNGYDGVYTATIPYNPVSANINYVNFNNPPLYGAYYDKADITKSQVGLEMGAECCRIFLPGCNFFGGRLLSPQQIWQPDKRAGEANINLGYNYQGKALYHELVFKQRRTGCQDADVDFTEALSTVPDNDPQGLATRLTLSHQKDYYFNRPWFKELDSYSSIPDSSSSLASNIISNSNVEYTEIGDLADFITTNGSLSIDDGIVSNFSRENYASITNNSTYKNNNIYIFDFTTGSNVSSTQNIFHSEYFLNLEVSNNQLRSYSWSGRKTNTLISIEPNKHYKIKVVVSNSNTKTFYRINDDNTETQLLVMTDSGMSFNNTDYSSLIGLSSYNHEGPFLGTMDFKNCSIQLSGSEDVIPFIEIVEKTRPMTDDEFYNSYKLDYNTFADALNLPK